MLNILRLRSCVRSSSAQRSQWSVFTFGGPGSVRRAVKSSHSPKVLGKCPPRILHEHEHTWKGQVQGQVTRGHYKIKVTNMLCDTCLFSGSFASRYRWWQSFDPGYNVIQSDFWWRSGQGWVKYSNQYFLHKKYMFLVQNLIRIPNMSFVFLYDA